MESNLARLEARWDIAMMGLIHMSVLGKGPEQLKDISLVIQLDN